MHYIHLCKWGKNSSRTVTIFPFILILSFFIPLVVSFCPSVDVKINPGICLALQRTFSLISERELVVVTHNPNNYSEQS